MATTASIHQFEPSNPLESFFAQELLTNASNLTTLDSPEYAAYFPLNAAKPALDDEEEADEDEDDDLDEDDDDDELEDDEDVDEEEDDDDLEDDEEDEDDDEDDDEELEDDDDPKPLKVKSRA